MYWAIWCKVECNRIIIHSHMPYAVFCSKFPLYCNLSVVEKDETVAVYAYEIEVVSIRFWNYIEAYNYSIDVEDDISHIYFFKGNRNIALLETVDYENYILMEEPVDHQNIFLFQKEMIQENIQCCVKGKSDIDEIIQGESWEALGLE